MCGAHHPASRASASSAAARSPRGSPGCLARSRRARHPDEHARADGAHRAQHRPRPGGHLPDPLHDDGHHGARHHVHDHAASRSSSTRRRRSPEEVAPRRPSGPRTPNGFHRADVRRVRSLRPGMVTLARALVADSSSTTACTRCGWSAPPIALRFTSVDVRRRDRHAGARAARSTSGRACQSSVQPHRVRLASAGGRHLQRSRGERADSCARMAQAGAYAHRPRRHRRRVSRRPPPTSGCSSIVASQQVRKVLVPFQGTPDDKAALTLARRMTAGEHRNDHLARHQTWPERKRAPRRPARIRSDLHRRRPWNRTAVRMKLVSHDKPASRRDRRGREGLRPGDRRGGARVGARAARFSASPPSSWSSAAPRRFYWSVNFGASNARWPPRVDAGRRARSGNAVRLVRGSGLAQRAWYTVRHRRSLP